MGDNGSKPAIRAISAAARIGGALVLASFEEPLTVCDLGKAIAQMHDYEWQQLKPSTRRYYMDRVRSILPSIETVAGMPIAEGMRDGRLVFFLLEPP